MSTAALTATGGIALLYAGVPLMRGVGEGTPDPSPRPLRWPRLIP